MMNKIYFFLLWLATAAAGMALSACSKSNDYVYVDDDDEPDKATVSVVAEDGTVSLLVPQSTIGLFVIDEGGNVTYREVVVDANGKIVLPEGADASSLILYSPCQAEWGRDALYTPQRFQVQENQSTEKGYQASDLLVAVRGTSAGTRSSDISLSFRHMMARMVIHIVDEVGSTDFSSVSMRLLGMNNSVDVSLQRSRYPRFLSLWPTSGCWPMQRPTAACLSAPSWLRRPGSRQITSLSSPTTVPTACTASLRRQSCRPA